MDDDSSSVFADLYTMSTIDVPPGVEVAAVVLAEQMAGRPSRFVADLASLATVVTGPDHPYGDPMRGAVAARSAIVDGVFDPLLPGRWVLTER